MGVSIYDEINSMEDLGLIAGNTFTLEFEFYDQNNVALDLTGGSVSYRLAPLARPNATILDITGTITGLNTAEIILSTSDTEGLGGEYIGQPRLADFQGDLFIPAQQEVIIIEDNESL